MLISMDKTFDYIEGFFIRGLKGGFFRMGGLRSTPPRCCTLMYSSKSDI